MLSPFTQDYDRGSKFKMYLDSESLQEYITISSLEFSVKKCNKQAGESWLLHINEAEDTFTIDTINLQLALMALYRNVVFE